MIPQLQDISTSPVGEAYTALFNLIHSFPEPFARTWWSGAYRTLEHRTILEQLAAIKVYGEMAQKAYERYAKRMQS